MTAEVARSSGLARKTTRQAANALGLALRIREGIAPLRVTDNLINLLMRGSSTG
jgi:hypothetical protein